MGENKANEEKFRLQFADINLGENKQQFFKIADEFIGEGYENTTEWENAMPSRIQVLVELYFSNKIAISSRKEILKYFMSFSSTWRSHVICEICSLADTTLSSSFANTDTIVCTIEKIIPLLNERKLNEKIIVHDYNAIINFYDKGLTTLLAKLETELHKVEELKIINSLHIFLRTLIISVDLIRVHNISKTIPVSLYNCIREILSFQRLPTDVVYNCGLLIVTLDYGFFQNGSSIKLLTDSSEISPLERLSICHGFLANVPVNFMAETKPSSDNSLLDIILKTTFSIYDSHVNDTSALVGILKVITVFAKRVSITKYSISERQLDMVLSILCSHLEYAVDIIKTLSKEALVHIINQKSDYVYTKLLQFLKDSRQVERTECIIVTYLSKVIPIFQITDSYESLNEDLLTALKNDVSFTYVSQAYVSLMVSDFSNNDTDEWFDKWVSPILSNADEFGILLEYMLIPAAKLSPVVVSKLLLFCRNVEGKNYGVIAKCMLKMKCCNVLSKGDNVTSNELNLNSKMWKNIFPVKLIQEALCIPNSENAIITVSLILENVKENEAFTEEEQSFFKLFINSHLASEKSDTRQKVLSVLRKIFTRIYSSNLTKSPDLHSNFIKRVINQCLKNLFPGASYARRFTVLRILLILIELGLLSPAEITSDAIIVFFTCLTDSFEENKQIAKNILVQLNFQNQEYFTNEIVTSMYRRTFDMIQGIKFSEHNTAAYMLEILCIGFQLNGYISEITENKYFIDMVKNDNNMDGTKNILVHLLILFDTLKNKMHKLNYTSLPSKPVHGLLHVIRHLLKCVNLKDIQYSTVWNALVHDIIEICISCNNVAHIIVSIAAPEGYVLENDECDECDLSANDRYSWYSSAQKSLLCGWRTVKEASLILGHVVERFSISDNPRTFIDAKSFLLIGNHLKEIIRLIKHRGAVEQVYISLCQFCNQCKNFPDYKVNEILRTWWVEITNIIKNDSGCCSLFRRSAGIPYLIQAILSLELNNKKHKNINDEFIECMLTIFDLPDSVVETKVHTLNVLRALFKNKHVSKELNNYVEKSVIISINGFKSTDWNEKNSSTLLFSALLIKIFGVPRFRHEISWKNKMSFKMFFQRYPGLFDFFLNLLKENDGVTIPIQSALFPVLLIFARLYVSDYNDMHTQYQINMLIPYIYAGSKSSVCKIRELTAVAIVPFITRDIYVEHLQKLWSHIALPFPENTIHGLLLQLAGLLQHVPSLSTTKAKEFHVLLENILKESIEILEGEHSYVVKEQLIAILSIVVSNYFMDIDVDKFPCSFMTQKEIKTGYLINKEKYYTSCYGLNLGVMYYKHLKGHTENEFIKFLETKIQNTSVEETTNLILEFVLCMFERENVDLKNRILLQFIPTGEELGGDTKRLICNSNVVYTYIKSRLKQEEDCRLKDILLVLSHFLKVVPNEELSLVTDMLSNLCQKHYNNSRLMLPFITCMDMIFERQKNVDEKCLGILVLLMETTQKPYGDYQNKLREFLFKHYDVFSLDSNTKLFLDLWTFIVERIFSIDGEEYEYFRNLLFEEELDEENIIAYKIIGKFVTRFESKPSICAVGLVTWILKDIGVLICNVEKKTVFCNDLPDYFEDQLILCDISCSFLEALLKSYPAVLHDQLDEDMLKWVLKQCALKNDAQKMQCLNDVITVILQQSKGILNETSSAPIFHCYKAVEKQLISRKISFFDSLLTSCDNV